ncbi:hypothetical protein PUN28_008726 [Cardiocondyla obscurior]|uniref:Uncharacterized protein n=1 Tax=Cardiocondyla obscurior TaxID=286306 RepID=A0AAW2G5B6_9HYME
MREESRKIRHVAASRTVTKVDRYVSFLPPFYRIPWTRLGNRRFYGENGACWVWETSLVPVGGTAVQLDRETRSHFNFKLQYNSIAEIRKYWYLKSAGLSEIEIKNEDYINPGEVNG